MVSSTIILITSLLVFPQDLALSKENANRLVRPFELTVTPTHVNRFASKSMNLRCAHNSSAETKMVRVFRMRILKKSESGWKSIADQRDMLDPVVEGDMTVVSSISDDTADAFLEVYWNNVSEDNFGVFMCDVMGFDAEFVTMTENSYEIDFQESDAPDEFFVNLSKETREQITDLKESTDEEMLLLKRRLRGLERSAIAFRAKQIIFENNFRRVELKQNSCQNRLAALETFQSSLTQWPGGFYALPQPRDGCPVDLAFFSGAHRFQKVHTDSDNLENSLDSHSSVFLPSTSVLADSKKFFTLELCEATQKLNTASWPSGSFCIHKLKHKPCPWGFMHGHVFIDTEDNRFSSEGRSNAAYTDRNVQLYFCCQGSRSASTPIQLPTASPFLLYRHGGECQAVQGMRVSEEHFQLDTEDDDNADETSGGHPDMTRGRTYMKFHLCYYTKL